MQHDNQAPLRILRRREVAQRTGRSVASIYRDMGRGAFPAAVPLSETSVGWLEHEVENWIEARIAERDAKLAERDAAG